jgi:hypothetical protein
MTASFFFSANVYPWQVLNSLPLVGTAIQVVNDDRTGACEKLYISSLYTTDAAWDVVYQSYLDYFRLNYYGADIRLNPDGEKDTIAVRKAMGANIMTLQKRNLSLSVRRVQEAGPAYGTYIWTSNDSNLRDAVAKANSAYAIYISYIPNVTAAQENCTDWCSSESDDLAFHHQRPNPPFQPTAAREIVRFLTVFLQRARGGW